MNLDPSLEKSLDRLISVAMDSHKRYHHAALDVGKEYLVRFFNQQSAIRQRHADELQARAARSWAARKVNPVRSAARSIPPRWTSAW